MSNLTFRELVFEFFLNEVSRNDPIPEITRDQKNLAIFLIGPPASGKTTFFDSFIEPKQKFITRYSTDKLSKIRRNWDPEHQDKPKGKYIKGTSKFTEQLIQNHVKTGENFVWDTARNRVRDLKDLVDIAKDAGYKILFIYKLTQAKTALSNLISRNLEKSQPNTDIRWAMGKYAGKELADRSREDRAETLGTGLNTDKAQKMMKKISVFNPDGFYLVLDLGYEVEYIDENGEKKIRTEYDRFYYKYENGELKIRKGSGYVSLNELKKRS